MRYIVAIILALLVAAIVADKSKYFACLKTCRSELVASNSTDFRSCFDKCANVKKAAESTLADTEQGFDTSALWDRYRSALFAFIRRKGKSAMTDMGLQMVTEPMEANWYKYDKNLAFIANRVSKFGSLFEPTTSTIPKQYESFLNNIEIISNSAPAQIKEQHRQFTSQLIALETQMEDEMNTCANSYTEITQFSPMSYDEYEKNFCPQIEHVSSQIKRMRGKLVELNQAVLGPFADVYNGINDLVSDTNRDWTDYSSLKNFVNNAQAGRGDPLSYSLESKTDISETRTWYKKKTSGFLFFKKSSSASRVEHRFQSEHFDMSIKAESFGAIRVEPKGKWLKPLLIQKYKDANFWRNKSMTFFGEQGNLPMMPITYYVMYKPAVLLSVSQKDGYFFEENKQSSFTFGPFASKAGSTMKVEKKNENDYRVTFETNNDEPVIVAVENHIF